MAWSAPRTWQPLELVTAAMMNGHVRDQLLETAPAKVVAKGDLVAATGTNAIARVAVGANGTVLMADSSAPAGVAWSNALRDLDQSGFHYWDNFIPGTGNRDAWFLSDAKTTITLVGNCRVQAWGWVNGKEGTPNWKIRMKIGDQSSPETADYGSYPFFCAYGRTLGAGSHEVGIEYNVQGGGASSGDKLRYITLMIWVVPENVP